MTAAIVFMALGAICVDAPLNEWRKERGLRAVGKRTDGVVIGHVWSGRYRYPVFRFQTPDGRTFDVQSQLGMNPPMYRVGAAVRVLYANPEDARIDRAAFGGIGLLFS